MKIAVLIARIVLGLIFAVFGVNYFVPFMPQPEMNAEAGAFIGALAASGYIFPVMKLIDIVCGILLLIGRFVPLALTLLAPIIINILLFHIFLETSGLVMAVVIVVLECFLAWAYCDAFRGVLAANAQPRG